MIRLIDMRTLELKSFQDGRTPPYAIASHRWQGEEITYRVYKDWSFEERSNYAKVNGFCTFLQNRQSDLKRYIGYAVEWLWIDTCCIDQDNMPEISEAINMMFDWYSEAAVCLAFLADCSSIDTIHTSEWFDRGWTLQELLAPDLVLFVGGEWQPLGHKLTKEWVARNGTLPWPLDDSAKSSVDKAPMGVWNPKQDESFGYVWHELLGPTLNTQLSQDIGLPAEVLTSRRAIEGISVTDVLAWISARVTTRKEDEAYCLLGILDVSMPLCYGEREHAMIRLLEQVEVRYQRQAHAQRSLSARQAELLPWTTQPQDALADKINEIQLKINDLYLERRSRKQFSRPPSHLQALLWGFLEKRGKSSADDSFAREDRMIRRMRRSTASTRVSDSLSL